jgi:hypothetical protein
VTTQLNKNHLTIIAIFAMSVIPFMIAWYFADHPDLVRLGVSNGNLITPPITTEYSEFTGYDDFSAQNLQELHGHWVLINVVQQNPCSAACQDALYKSRQITLMLGKDIARLRRVAAMPEIIREPALSGEWLEDGRLIKVKTTASLQQKFAKIFAGPITEGSMLLMDPLGNLMMKYPAGFDPYQVKNDLSKLLRISQIG